MARLCSVLSMTKNIVVYNPARFNGEAWLPVLWAQARTFCQKNSQQSANWNWVNCTADLWGEDFDRTCEIIAQNPPDIFAASLYVWNYQIVHRIAQWVKSTWPHCLVITGGPHQYFKHDDSWFRQNTWIDASLPGECYGELCFAQILDNIAEDNSIDWNTVSDVVYPHGRARLKKSSTKVNHSRRDFDYSWSAMHSQFDYLQQFAAYAAQNFPQGRVLSIIETTRGCPYGCTYCDWGGGINTSVLQKPEQYVRQDIDALCKLDLDYVYFADANLGMFGVRDVENVKYLAQQRFENNSKFTVGYGGFAKTENRLSYIRQILEIDIRNQLSTLGEIKISMQSLDDDVLKQINRKNVSLDSQIETLQSLSDIKKLPIYVEMIYGLPGMTTQKFYHELDELGRRNLSVQWYPWILLPEAPAYSRQYRADKQLQTVIKTTGWSWVENSNSLNEIVVGAKSYTTDQYLEMLLASSLYRLFIQGGYLSAQFEYIRMQGTGTGSMISEILHKFMPGTSWMQTAQTTWQEQVLVDPAKACYITVDGHEVYLGLYFSAVAFLNQHDFTNLLSDWLSQRYCIPGHLSQQDIQQAVTQFNIGCVSWRGLTRISHNRTRFKTDTVMEDVLLQFHQFENSGSILKAQSRWLGMF